MHFEFVFSVLAFTCYGLINTTVEREIDFGTRKCEEEMISALNKSMKILLFNNAENSIITI